MVGGIRTEEGIKSSIISIQATPKSSSGIGFKKSQLPKEVLRLKGIVSLLYE